MPGESKTSCFRHTCNASRTDEKSDKRGKHKVAALAYLAIRLIRKGIRNDLAGRDASKADEAAKRLAEAVSQRLGAYPIFGPERAAGGHSAGHGRCEGERHL